MDFNTYIANNRLEIIKHLFEVAVRNTVEKCRSDYQLANLYRTPFPVGYWGYEEHRTIKDKFIEKSCEARIVLAFELAQPIREKMDFYDLICCAMPYYQDDERNKYIYNEVIKYTKSDEIKDLYIEKLYKLNLKLKALNRSRISEDIRKYIVNFDETQEAFDILIDRCDLPFNPYSIKDIQIGSVIRDSCGCNHTHNIELSIIGDSFNMEKMGYENKEVRFRFTEVKHFSISDKHTGILNIAETKAIDGYGDTITFTCGDAINIQASKIETLYIRKWLERIEFDEDTLGQNN